MAEFQRDASGQVSCRNRTICVDDPFSRDWCSRCLDYCVYCAWSEMIPMPDPANTLRDGMAELLKASKDILDSMQALSFHLDGYGNEMNRLEKAIAEGERLLEKQT